MDWGALVLRSFAVFSDYQDQVWPRSCALFGTLKGVDWHPFVMTPSHTPKPPRRVMGNAERQFALTHLNLARQQAHAFARRHGVPVEELLGPAYEGLCKAALGFDASRGWKPSSYVVPKVKGELLHHLRDTGYLPRISHRLRELWQRGRRYLPLALEDQQIADLLGVSLAEWLDCRRACGLPPISLD